MSRFRECRTLLLLSFTGLTLLVSGCQTGPRAVGPVRALWVTRFDYRTPQDIVRIMDNCSHAGFNTVLLQVRGNGTVSYPSRIEPWAEQFDFRNPGFDPLGLAVREAHRRGLQLHAWVNVMPGWRGPGEPAVKRQLYHTHPEWFWYDRHGRRQPIRHEAGGESRDWYVSLNPCLPEVRAYLVNLFRELVTRYDVDGLHMDYIRFPNESVVSGERVPDYPRDRRTLALFKRDTGHTPESNRHVWNRWRTDQVTRLVAEVRAMMRRTKPDVVLSAAVGSVRQSALTHFQDAWRWMNEGTVDVVYLMNYTPDAGLFRARVRPWLSAGSKGRVVPGLMIRDRSDARRDAHIARQQIEIARAATGSFCVFAYSLLFDSGNTEFDKQNTEARRRRAQRRELLIPFLQSLARPRRIAGGYSRDGEWCSLPV